MENVQSVTLVFQKKKKINSKILEAKTLVTFTDIIIDCWNALIEHHDLLEHLKNCQNIQR